MIRSNEVYRIGTLGKPHGVKGEINFTFTDDSFDRKEADFLILLLDGILVPFFIDSYRFRADDVAIIKFEGVDTAERAKMYANTEVYLLNSFLDDDDDIPTWNFFVGFTVEDIHHGLLGTITHVEDSTLNVLFVIEGASGEILLPAHESFIKKLDRKNKRLEVDVPDGLI